MLKLIAMNDLNRRVGQDHHNAKLTDGEVEVIRSLAEGGMRYVDIAEKFEINHSTVGKICRYERRGQTVDHFQRAPLLVPPAPAEQTPAINKSPVKLSTGSSKPTASHKWRRGCLRDFTQ